MTVEGYVKFTGIETMHIRWKILRRNGKSLHPIPGYDGYFATRDGEIWSDKRQNVLKQIKQRPYQGYNMLMLVNNKREKKLVKTHRLIALTFIPNLKGKPCVNHKNGIKADNKVENLEWCTYSENIKHAYDTGLHSNQKPVEQYLKHENILIATYQHARDAGRTLGIPHQNISECCYGRQKSAKGYRFIFKGESLLPYQNNTGIVQCKTVEQINKEGKVVGVFTSCVEAASAVNGTRQNISLCCLNPHRTHKGYRWRYTG